MGETEQTENNDSSKINNAESTPTGYVEFQTKVILSCLSVKQKCCRIHLHHLGFAHSKIIIKNGP